MAGPSSWLTVRITVSKPYAYPTGRRLIPRSWLCGGPYDLALHNTRTGALQLYMVDSNNDRVLKLNARRLTDEPLGSFVSADRFQANLIDHVASRSSGVRSSWPDGE